MSFNTTLLRSSRLLQEQPNSLEARGIDVSQRQTVGGSQTCTYSFTVNANYNVSNSFQCAKYGSDLKFAAASSRQPGVSEYNQGFLKAVNEYRKRHGAEPLKLSQALCKSAEEWAKRLAQMDSVQCRPNATAQSVFCSSSTDPAAAPDSWYGNGNKYQNAGEFGSTNSGSFGIMMSKERREIGVGMAQSRTGRVYVVAEYDSPSISIGQTATSRVSFQKESPKVNIFTKADTNRKNSSEGKTIFVEIPGTKLSTKQATVGTVDYRGNNFEQDCLKSHNDYRKKHRAPPLKLNKQLCSFAQEWANNLAARETMCHRQNSPYGENIYMSYGMEVTGETAVNAWYSEIKKYNFRSGGFSGNTGHFTQVVWKNSRELGVGIAKSRRGSTFVVANYDPPGNVVGQFPENVLSC